MLVVSIPSFLHSSLHPSICESHYAIPFLSHYTLIVHIWLAPPFMHSTAFFLSASYHNLPFPPSSFNASIYKSYYIPLNAFIITPIYLCISLHQYPCTFLCAFLFVHLIMAPSNMHMSLFPFQMFTLPYILLCLHLITSNIPRFNNKLTKTDR